MATNATDFLLANGTTGRHHQSTPGTGNSFCTFFQQLSSSPWNVSSSVPTNGTGDYTWSIFYITPSMQLLLEINLIISSVAMIITLVAYMALSHLRTVPGRCLMGVITSELAVNLFFFLAMEFRSNKQNRIGCILVAIFLHYFYLTILTWNTVIAHHIWWKIRYTTAKIRRLAGKHLLFVYLTPLALVVPGLCLQFGPVSDKMKPQYGWKYCGISNIHFRLLFYTIPAFISFCFSLVTFLRAIAKIKESIRSITANAHHTNASNATTVTQRLHRTNLFLSYIKLSILLGVFNILSFAGNIFSDGCQVINFILTMITCSHGFWIFVAFACKRSVFRGLKSHSIVAINSWRQQTRTFVSGSVAVDSIFSIPTSNVGCDGGHGNRDQPPDPVD